WSAILFNGSSGGGGCAEYDGWPLMYTPGTFGGLKFVPIEVLELHYPLLVLEHRVRTDSMGAGRTRGGPGLIFHLTPLGKGQVDTSAAGHGMPPPPFGVYGGKPGDGGALYRVNRDGSRTFFSGIGYFRVHEGESWVATSTGGGGYGDPLERDPELVRIDGRDGFVSLRSARDDYGVGLDRVTLELDLTATEVLRRELASARQPALIVPDRPDAATYWSSLMRAEDRYELNPQPPMDADLTL